MAMTDLAGRLNLLWDMMPSLVGCSVDPPHLTTGFMPPSIGIKV
jgi:hypothetical protein